MRRERREAKIHYKTIMSLVHLLWFLAAPALYPFHFFCPPRCSCQAVLWPVGEFKLSLVSPEVLNECVWFVFFSFFALLLLFISCKEFVSEAHTALTTFVQNWLQDQKFLRGKRRLRNNMAVYSSFLLDLLLTQPLLAESCNTMSADKVKTKCTFVFCTPCFSLSNIIALWP